MPTQLSIRLFTLLCIALMILSSCGDEVSEDNQANQAQMNLKDEAQPDPDPAEPDVSTQADTVTATKKPEDDGKDNSKEPCNDLIRKQISSQKGSIDELKEMLAEETDADAQVAMKEEIQVMEKEAEALGLRYDCE